MSAIRFRSAARSDPGTVREQNEDTWFLDDELGLYLVLDGMGGHKAGQVASEMARNATVEVVRAELGNLAPRDVMERAIQRANQTVFEASKKDRKLKGMGTTIVACLLCGEDQALISHVGDSRAYLLRDGLLTRLTADHTIVAELVAKRAIRPDEAHLHPYASVLSRNLGGRAKTRVDHADVPLAPGDRIILCSDGLSGYASFAAIEQITGGAENPDRAVEDLIQIAIAGGGGDNVTALVVEAGRPHIPKSTQFIRTSGASGWWERRELFLHEAKVRGLGRSPICAVLSEEEAVEIVAGNLCEAIYRDLEHTTGIHVWTYSENLARGWFDQGGDYEDLRVLLDLLRGCAQAVIEDIAAEDASFAVALDIAVTRSLIVCEMVVGGLLGAVIGESAAPEDLNDVPVATESVTQPFAAVGRATAPTPEIGLALERAREAALAAVPEAEEQARVALEHCHAAARDYAGDSDLVEGARELYGPRILEEDRLLALFNSLARAEAAHLAAIDSLDIDGEVAATAGASIALAHHRLAYAVALVATDVGRPTTDRLREVAEANTQLRARMGRGEQKLARLEREITRRKLEGA